MIAAGLFDRSVTFQRREADANGDPLGAWADILTRSAMITPLKLASVKMAETVVDMRLQGNQPVLITVRRDSVTRGIDNGDRAFDARTTAPHDAPETVWNIASAIWNQVDDVMEFLAVQHRGGSDA